MGILTARRLGQQGSARLHRREHGGHVLGSTKKPTYSLLAIARFESCLQLQLLSQQCVRWYDLQDSGKSGFESLKLRTDQEQQDTTYSLELTTSDTSYEKEQSVHFRCDASRRMQVRQGPAPSDAPALVRI